MDKYTIYCTVEQTKKAIELGANIEGCPIIDGVRYKLNRFYFKNEKTYKCPTAEQMIGWLRTKGFAFGITEYNDNFNNYVSWRVANNKDECWYISDDKLKDPKEAIFSSIDAALDYLTKTKKSIKE